MTFTAVLLGAVSGLTIQAYLYGWAIRARVMSLAMAIAAIAPNVPKRREVWIHLSFPSPSPPATVDPRLFDPVADSVILGNHRMLAECLCGDARHHSDFNFSIHTFCSISNTLPPLLSRTLWSHRRQLTVWLLQVPLISKYPEEQLVGVQPAGKERLQIP